MNKKVIITTIALLIIFSAFAQNKKITGIVLDLDQKPINYATVVLQNSDSIYIDYMLTDSAGRFSFDSILTSYRLIIQHTSYNAKELLVDDNKTNIIYLEPNILEVNQVVVKGERPLVRVINGIITYDIAQITNNRTTSSAYDAVLNLPGVIEQNGVISMMGTSQVAIILNGRPANMSYNQLITLLKQMPSSYIKNAEIMYSTPPQYKVRGAAINLITKNTINDNGTPLLQGEVNSSYIQKQTTNYSAGANLLYSSKKISADILYSFYDLNEYSDVNLFSKHNLDGKVHDITQYNKGNSESQIHTARLGIDYKLSEKSSLNLVYNTTIHANDRHKELSTGNFSTSNNFKTGEYQLHNTALDYSSNFGMKAGISYTSFTSPSTQNFNNIDTLGKVTKFITDTKQNINSFVLYIDQNHSLKKEWGLTYGAKFNYANDYSFQKYHNIQGDIPTHNTDNITKEYILDLYVGTNKKLTDKWSMNLSVTGEYYKFVKDEKFSLFPQMQLTYLQSQKNIFQFAFSSDKQYPSYWEKQDYKGYLNNYMELHGNPNLKVYNTYSTQLVYIRNQKYIFSIYSIYQPDYATQLGYQSSDKLSFIYKTSNWDYDFKVGFNAVIPFNINSWFNSKLTFNGFYNCAKSNSLHGINFNNHKFIGYVASDNTFNISSKPNIKLELSAYYMTSPIQGLYTLSQIYNVNAGLKWTLEKQNLEFMFKATDIFNSSTPNIYVKENGQNFNMFVNQDFSLVQFSIKYKFGGYKNKARKKIDASRFGQ